ncbi:MAG: hypothetical protein PWR13_871 [Archaeoglobi archaeon]|nr:hypothetical protein [Archaeoglobi archaeon]MDK2781843.1 hypothetical protein [Archaeoglobi archaeon]
MRRERMRRERADRADALMKDVPRVLMISATATARGMRATVRERSMKRLISDHPLINEDCVEKHDGSEGNLKNHGLMRSQDRCEGAEE